MCSNPPRLPFDVTIIAVASAVIAVRPRLCRSFWMVPGIYMTDVSACTCTPHISSGSSLCPVFYASSTLFLYLPLLSLSLTVPL